MVIEIKQDFNMWERTPQVGLRVRDYDDRLRRIIRLDLDKVELITTLRSDETTIWSFTRRDRLDLKKYVLLGATVFDALDKCKENIPDFWSEPSPIGIVQPVVFDGSIVNNICTSGEWVYAFLYSRGGWYSGTVSITGFDTQACRSAVLPVEYL